LISYTVSDCAWRLSSLRVGHLRVLFSQYATMSYILMRGCRSLPRMNTFIFLWRRMMCLFRLVENVPVDVVPLMHHEPLFVKGGMVVYVSRGRAFRDPASSAFTFSQARCGWISPAQEPTLGAGSGLAARTAVLLKVVRTIGRSRN